MTTFVVAHLWNVNMGPGIVAYIEAIDATLSPFGGRFVVHGGPSKRILEGDWRGDLIMLAFPDRKAAEDWYASPDYQKILPLRTDNSDGDIMLIDGVGDDHRATDILQ